MRETFLVPNVDHLIRENEFPNKVFIISIIGKSPYNSSGTKIKSLGKLFSQSGNKEEGILQAIEGFYDEENQIIYLHVHSLLDSDILVKNYETVSEHCQDKYNSDEFLTVYNEVRNKSAQLLLVLFHISHVVVLSHPGCTFDVSYVHYLKAIYQMRQELLEDISEELKKIKALAPDWISTGRPCTPRLLFFFDRSPKNVPDIKKLEHDMEDRIYHILRKVRVIGNSNASSLCAIPLNEEFVFMSTEKHIDRLGHTLKKLMLGCRPGATVDVQAPFCSQTDSEHSFHNFLHVHIQQARNKGFDDAVSFGRHSQQYLSYFELPNLSHWAQACKAVYNIVMQSEPIALLCTETRFSEQRCQKVLPLALACYQEGFLSHYTQAVHKGRLSVALALFGAQARGPLFQEYSRQLITECHAFWEAGRQLCEAASLTNNPCNLSKHGPDREHCSGVRYIAACDCGRKQGPRDDPYSLKQANCTFYQQLSKECVCKNLERINFPVFEPSIKEYKPATLSDSEEPSSVSLDNANELTPDSGECGGLVRQASTTEYLPGMLTLSSPPGLLPHYSSWSLLCLGPSSLYSHNLGLTESHHPGFLNSTNYLLPWDVTVYPRGRSPWPQINKHSGRGRKPRTTSSQPQFTVKVFIGIEYECSRGHRFMLAAPDRVLRAAPGSTVKDTAHKLVESDLPLYFQCPCRSTKPLIAQLMRLHVVTPKAPVHCQLNAKVQPAVGAPIFVSNQDGPLILTQSAYWVMRMPYVYVSEKEKYSENSSARLLAGAFSVSEIE